MRKETPSLTGRGQPLGDLGTGAGARGGGLRAAGEDALGARAHARRAGRVLRVLEKKPFDAGRARAPEGAALRAALRQQRQSELFRAFLVAARDRYEISRNAEAYRRALGQEQ